MRFARSLFTLCAAAAAAVGLSSCAMQSGGASPAAATAAPQANRAAIDALVERIAIPYQEFTLENGLRVIVHTDRKAPVVAVSVWYDVGSKHEPAGRTGFAHLFEHLMFNGSENAPGDFFRYLENMGATDYNGTTNTDRTNYFQTVPTGALDNALFLESDRMGHLLGAVTQDVLNSQRGVVQNEKRQGDNQPFGLLRYYIFENLTPQGHPYHHSTIGSMADLSSASLDDVQGWFRNNYGPNNAVLVLAGDIDVATARPMVERHFGSIARGPEVVHPRVDIPTLPAPLHREVTDQVATTRIYRMWAIPGWASEESPQLQVFASVLGGLNSSRLDNILVRQEQLAVSVNAYAQPFEDMGLFVIQADLKPGADAALLARRLDEITAELMRDGPSEDEVQRAIFSSLSGQLSGLESVGGFGGRAVALAQGTLFTDNPAYFRTQIRRFASATPASVRATAQQWLSRPVFGLTYRPGARTDSGDGRGGAIRGAEANPFAPAYYRAPTTTMERTMGETASAVGAPAALTQEQQAAAQPAAAATPARPARAMPAVQPTADLDFPAIERATLRNGVPVYLTRRSTVPTVRVSLMFDAGSAADRPERAGLQSLMLSVMQEGTTTRNASALAEEQERLGANISTGFGADRTSIGLYMLSSNIRPALALLADVARNPAFADGEINRLRASQLSGIAQELNNPGGLANRAFGPLVYGAQHPYGAISGSGTLQSVRAITRDDLVRFHQQWIRPDNMAIFVSGDVPLRQLVSELNRAFGDWQAPSQPRGVKDFAVAIPTPQPRIILINRPNSPQSLIVAGQVLGVNGRDDILPLQVANDVLGGGFLSRINMNLRERNGWSYGAGAGVGGQEDRVTFRVQAPVQTDRTADAIREIQSELRLFLGAQGITGEELERTINGRIRELPGSFETSSDLLGGMQTIITRNRPDNYYETLAGRYRTMTSAQLDSAIRAGVDPSRFVYVVVGDATVVRPQLETLGMPIEEVNRAALGGE